MISHATAQRWNHSPNRAIPMIDQDELRRTTGATFEGLPRTTLARIATAAALRRYAKGATLYRASSRADGLYIVLSGRVRVSRETQAHLELLHSEGPGGVLGEIPVFGGGSFPATATAVEPTRCAHVPIEAVQRLLDEDRHFVRFALHRLANRARSLLRRIDDLTASTIPTRVARMVLARANSESSGGEFTMGASQEAIAAELGTAREVVVRALRGLVAAGAIARAGRSRFVLANEALLRTMAGDGK